MEIFSALYRYRLIPFLKKWNIVNYILGFLDILAIVLSFQVAFLINYSFESNHIFFADRRILILFLGILPFWLLILYLLKVTEIPRTKRNCVLLFEYLLASVAVSFLLILYYFLFKLYPISRSFMVQVPIYGFIFLFSIRLVEYKVFKLYRASGYNYVNLILIADASSLTFIESLLGNKEWGYRIVAIFTDSETIRKKYEDKIIILPDEFIKVMNDLMEVDMIDEVLFVRKKIIPADVRSIVRSCDELGVIFRLMYRDEKISLNNAVKTQIADYKFLTFINIPHNQYALAIKKMVDMLGSIVLIIITSPLMLAIAIAIKVTSRGPVIYSQARVGLRGRPFMLYKFRSMVAGADQLQKDLESLNEADGPAFKIKNDPRITPVGNFLRKTGLDELPQLFNILKGEMSLIGPRPPLPSEILQYERWQLRRLSIKPGLSCFWQVKPDRNSIKFEKWMEMDLAYIDNWSLRLDFVILLKTLKTIINRTGL